MATESPIRMLETRGRWASHKGAAAFSSAANLAASEEALLVKGHRYHSGRGVVPNRSGSAPPNMEGSLAAIENIMQNSGPGANLAGVGYDREFRVPGGQLASYSSSVSDYSSNIDLNAQFHCEDLASSCGGNQLRLTSFSGSSDNVLHLSRSSLPTHKEESEDDKSPQKTDNLIDRSSALWPARESSPAATQSRNIAEIKDGVPSMSSSSDGQSNAFCHGSASDGTHTCDADSSSLQGELTSVSAASPLGVYVADTTSVRQIDDVVAPVLRSISYDSRQGSSPATDSEDPSSIGILSENKNLISSEPDVSGVQNGIKALKISCPPYSESHGGRGERQHNFQNNLVQRQAFQQGVNFQFQGNMPQIVSQGTNTSYIVANQFVHGGNFSSAEAQPVLHSSGFTPPLYATAAATYMHSASPYYGNVQPPGIIYPPQYGMGGYPYNAGVLPPFLAGYPPHNAVPLAFDGTAAASSDVNTQVSGSWGGNSQGVDMQHMSRFYGHVGFPQPFVDPRLHPHHSFGDSYNVPGQVDPMSLRGVGAGGNQGTGGQSTASPRRGPIAVGDYGASSPNMGLLMQVPNSPLASPVLPRSPMGGGRSDVSSPNSGRSAGLYSNWQGQRGIESFSYQKPYSFLEELKSGKGRRFELSDITGHVVEFSVDQHGSRFIQQKLESCSVDDKASVFKEVLPHASKLMTDVFGNYVIQKFFEYGTTEQRKDLANALRGQILPLSLQMYGCRVIQKALDVIELEQKAELVRELDGHVMRCVRDQNGNHVIQKCIECVPTDKISFIISAFRGQVASLSMHPYGCRVIQRVLEYCTDELQTQFIVDEILESVCTLAQDQYGNYVTQHVLERGKPQERTQIVKNLSGQVVKMSQHKFASNVIEKCLEYGDPDARELLIVEVIGQNDGNDNLLVMMKDQYANYVVQKILETCTESQRDLLLGRIRVHLHALKKYTYGKHIVARFEQLFGESQAAGP